MHYDKPPLTIEEQARLLQDRGMLFDDSARVEHYLAHIGYYRLSAYWLPFEQPSERDNSSRNHYFRFLFKAALKQSIPNEDIGDSKGG